MERTVCGFEAGLENLPDSLSGLLFLDPSHHVGEGPAFSGEAKTAEVPVDNQH